MRRAGNPSTDFISTSEEIPHKSHAALWSCSILAVLLLYVLGSGPLEAFAFNGTLGMSMGTWIWLYDPLIKITNATGTNDWLNHYCTWWENAVL